MGRADRDLRRLREAPQVALGVWPTPIDRIDPGIGPQVLVKRDDLSGFGRGGAKARKLSHLLGYLRARGHDELIAAAGNVSNLAFDLVPACDRFGTKLRLFILDEPEVAAPGRELIFDGIRARIELVGKSHVGLLAAQVSAYGRARAQGGRPFVAFPGLSHPTAVVGNACGFLEMADQLLARGDPLPDVVFVTAGTGTTIAGFLIAARVLRELGHRIRVVGAQVYRGPIKPCALALVRWTERFLGLECAVSREEFVVDQSMLAGGFGRFTPRLVELCERVASCAQIAIDPIFGGKTWALLESFASRRACRRPLYWHCGFTPEWRMLGALQGAV